MSETLTGPWWRVLSMPAADPAGAAEDDYAAVRPAAVAAAAAGRTLAVAWLSRGDGAPLELLTTAAPATAPAAAMASTGPVAVPVPAGPAALGHRGKHAAPGPGRPYPPPAVADGPAAAGEAPVGPVAPAAGALLFPPGARAVPAEGCAARLDRLVWVPCPALPEAPPPRAETSDGPGVFETALIALMRRPFGWLVVAEPTDLLAAETAGLRTELEILRRHHERRTSLAAEQTERRLAERRLAERGTFGATGLWRVRVLAGASTPDELDVLAPLLTGAAELGPHPYRLRHTTGAQSLDAALAARHHDPADGAQSPFFVTAGTVTALAGLPRQGVPGLDLTRPAAGAASPAGPDAGDGERGAVPLAAPVTTPAGPDAGPDVTATAGDVATSLGPPATDVPDDSGTPGPEDFAGPDIQGRTVELGAPPDPGGAPVRVPLSLLRRGVLVAGTAGSGTARTVRHLLAQATEAGLPWLVLDPDGTGYQGLPATVINPADPDGVPLTVSLLAPEPGYPLHAHIALVSGLLDVAFGADDALSLIMAQALREMYRAAGWDLVTGRGSGAVPAAGAAPAAAPVPGLDDLHAAVTGLIGRSGYDRTTRARLRGTADARFGSLRDGSAGRFLAGGHPADPGTLLRHRVVLTGGDLGTAADRALVTGALLIRLAEHLRFRPRPAAHQATDPGLRHLLVLHEARTLLRDDGDGRPAARAAERLAALIPELAAGGTGTVLTERRPALLTRDLTQDPAVRVVHRLTGRADREAVGGAGDVTAAETAVVLADGIPQPRLVRVPPGPPADAGAATAPAQAWSPADRRSPACGRSCRTQRPCRLAELRGAELLAESPDQAWLRVWTEILVLAFLTDNPLPAVPAPLRRRWRGLATRLRECLLAQVAGHAVGSRATALRPHYDPARLTQVLVAAAAGRLDHPGGTGIPPVRPGPAWVTPQLRWLHEAERMSPLPGAALAPGDHAPPLDFDLPGLPDWPGIRVGQRIRALRRHPLSMALAANRRLAWTALVGEPGPGPFADDLGQVLPGVDTAQALRHTAGLLEVSGGLSAGPGWLEVVLSWPRRFVAGAGAGAGPGPGDAADGLAG